LSMNKPKPVACSKVIVGGDVHQFRNSDGSLQPGKPK